MEIAVLPMIQQRADTDVNLGGMSRDYSNSADIFGAVSPGVLKAVTAVRSRWRLVLLWGVCGFAAAFLISLLVPNKYTATASILPLTDNQPSRGLLALAEGIPGMDLLALPEKSPTALYPEIMSSDSLMLEVLSSRFPIKRGNKIVSQTLFEYFGINNRDEGLLALAKTVKFESNKKTGVIKIRAVTTDPELSAAICNKLIDRLENFNKTRRKTSASENCRFIEKRLVQLKTELEIAEENLKEFRQHNMNYYRAVDPELILLESRLAREVELKSQLYLTLAQQYELAAIQEKIESPIVQVLDIARPPTIKSSPARLRISLMGFLLGALISIGLLIIDYRNPGGLKILRLKKPSSSSQEAIAINRLSMDQESIGEAVGGEKAG